ncbi:hypothetical protein BGZ82_003402 [Podila clonocystis]|nr:hypothetical protein BGZ82_003402 [Podila clonocystis]
MLQDFEFLQCLESQGQVTAALQFQNDRFQRANVYHGQPHGNFETPDLKKPDTEHKLTYTLKDQLFLEYDGSDVFFIRTRSGSVTSTKRLLRGFSNLSKSDAVAFLFRTANRFEELRWPIIKVVADEGYAKIIRKVAQDKRNVLPEIVGLMGELLATDSNIPSTTRAEPQSGSDFQSGSEDFDTCDPDDSDFVSRDWNRLKKLEPVTEEAKMGGEPHYRG